MTPSPSANTPVYARMAVIGCGLIGASVILAARASGAVTEVAVADASPAARDRITALGFADLVTADPAEAVADADLVVFAVPVMAVGETARAAAPALKSGATVTDVGSVKAAVSAALAAALPEGCFIVPGHPIAGTEQSGPDAGFAELFQNRWVILTPQDRDDEPYADAIQRLRDFWTRLGSNVELMDDKHHD
ncbi:MAG TPA: prephenate dehydrogenase/arogenate dehydrogenase family protein, partial [Phenylobacterium sp.]|nr:prephenate dehydrogenase/arogenate dehydrogenase family protein [Phenylobacterium sp.]